MPEAQGLLTWSGYPDSGPILDEKGRIWAEVGSPLIGGERVGRTDRLVRRSGSPAGPAFETWGPKGWESLEAACEEQLAEGELLLLPHADDVLSDVQRCLKFLDGWGGRGFGLVVDPSMLITESMKDRAEDHAARIAAALLPREGVEAVVIPGAHASGLSTQFWAIIDEAAGRAGVRRVVVGVPTPS